MNESKTFRRNTMSSPVRQMSPNHAEVQFVDNRPSKFAGMLSDSGFVDNRSKTSLPIQRKIHFNKDNTDIVIAQTEDEKQKLGVILKELYTTSFVKDHRKTMRDSYLVPEQEFVEAVKKDLESSDKTLNVNEDGDISDGDKFVINATKELGPNPDNFEVDKPASGDIEIETVDCRYKHKKMPLESNKEKPGYVANIVSYYAENGVKDITKRYFDDAISGEEEEKSNRLGVVVGLNSFSPIIKSDYDERKNAVSQKLLELVLPKYPVNFQGFGFLWEPCWKLKGKHIPNFNIRWALEYTPEVKNRNEKFRSKQRELFANLPYGVFRETVMASNYIQHLVDQLKSYNNPVYIHSGDGDSVSLKVPDDTDTATGTKGILDRMDEHLEEKGTGAKIVIGGYNLYNLDEQKLIVEIVKADSGITDYADGSEIDKEKPSVDLKRYSENDKALIKAKVEQITHNTQVGNRYDRIIRDAISTVYPRMLYPTEPNMLIKAYDSSDDTDFFKTSFFDESHRLKQQGSLWGMGASEGRVFKEHLEKEYNQDPKSSGMGFVDWAKGASLPTDPRGFDRHILISGYERYPKKEEDLSPAQGDAADKLGQEVPLVEAAVQQAQSYTSAYRLAELYAQTLASKMVDKVQIRNDVLPAFEKVEKMVSVMMDGKCDLTSLRDMVKEPVPSVSLSQSEQVTPATIVNAIRKELLAKYKFYNGIP